MMIQVKQTQNLILINLAGNFNAHGSRKLEVELVNQKILTANPVKKILSSAKSKTIRINLNDLRYISAAGLSLLAVFINPEANVRYELMVNKNEPISSLLKYAFTGMTLHCIEPAMNDRTLVGKS